MKETTPDQEGQPSSTCVTEATGDHDRGDEESYYEHNEPYHHELEARENHTSDECVKNTPGMNYDKGDPRKDHTSDEYVKNTPGMNYDKGDHREDHTSTSRTHPGSRGGPTQRYSWTASRTTVMKNPRVKGQTIQLTVQTPSTRRSLTHYCGHLPYSAQVHGPSSRT